MWHSSQCLSAACDCRFPCAMRKSSLSCCSWIWRRILRALPSLKIWIMAEPAPPRSAQRGLFLPITPEAEKLEITLATNQGSHWRATSRHCAAAGHPSARRLSAGSICCGKRLPPNNLTMSEDASPPAFAMRMIRPAMSASSPIWQMVVRQVCRQKQKKVVEKS